MLLRILGSAAGGGLPQWNCSCLNCQAVRQEGAGVRSRTQSSLAIKANNGSWFLVNASPDVRQQLERLRDVPLPHIRSSPIAGVLLTDAEIDHTTGLIVLRESATPLQIYGTANVRQALTVGYPLLPTLESYCGVNWSVLEPGVSVTLPSAGSPELEVEVFLLPATPPKYMRLQPETKGEWAVGFTFREVGAASNGSGVITYAPALAALNDDLIQRFESSDCILIDGTCWRDDELPALGISSRTARKMGHLPLSGADGSLHQLAQLKCPRKILIHINNTNPILNDNSVERRWVEETGIEVSYDGLTIEL